MSNYSDRKSTRLNSSHTVISYAVFCLKKKNRVREPVDEREERVARAKHEGVERDSDEAPVVIERDPGAERVRVRHRFFFFNDTATTEIYTLSLHDALPI